MKATVPLAPFTEEVRDALADAWTAILLAEIERRRASVETERGTDRSSESDTEISRGTRPTMHDAHESVCGKADGRVT